MIRERVKLSKQKREKISRELRRVLGAKNISTNPAVLVGYSGSATVAPKIVPDFLVKPQNIEQIKKILNIAKKNKVPLTVMASGTQDAATHPIFGGIVMDTMGMNKILEINLDSAYAVIEPGVTIGRFSKELDKIDYHCTVGSFPPSISVIGNYTQTACNTHRSSGIRDDILGLEVVLPDGTLVQTGSKAFSATYPQTGWHSASNSFPDLRGLFIDACGTLGVITKAAIRIYPKNEAQAMPIASFEDYATSLEYMKKIVRANLVQHCSIWHWGLYTMIDHLQTFGQGAPFEIVLTDPWEKPDERPYTIVVPVMSGYREDMEGHIKACEKVAKELGGRIYNEELKEKFPGAYQFYEEHFIHHYPTRAFMGGYAEAMPLFPIVLADPTKVASLEKWGLRFLRKSPLKLGLSYYSHSLDQNRTIFLRMTPYIEATSTDNEIKRALAVHQKYLEEAYRKYGAVPIRNIYATSEERNIDKTGGFGILLKKIKNTIDPENILNPGIDIYHQGVR